MTRAAESTHWYSRSGEPCYEVPKKAGGMRPTTLADARKMGLCPSVTTIIKCAAAPALENWKQNQVLLAALTLPRRDGENDESFCARIVHDSQEQGRKARDRGTEIHAAVQGHYENQAPAPDLWDFVRGTADVVGANCGEQSWKAERSFSHPIGFGGKCDLSSQDWVIDFKTKEFGKEQFGELKTWDEHAMQLAAYREGLGLLSARCAIVYVSTTNPGLARLIEIDAAELNRGWQMFKGLLAYWQAKADYFPAAWKEAA